MMQTTPAPIASSAATTMWLDGELLADTGIALHGLTHALHYGSSVFEGIRLYPTPRGPAIFRLRDHVERLLRGACVYGLNVPSDALARGFDEAIMLNDRGTVAEGSGENIFVVRDGTLVTNDGSSDILEGITRASVLEIARADGIPTAVRAITRDDLGACDEAFFTGTAAEVVPIVRIDERALPDVRPITDRVRLAYAAIVRGHRPAPDGWLTFVS